MERRGRRTVGGRVWGRVGRGGGGVLRAAMLLLTDCLSRRRLPRLPRPHSPLSGKLSSSRFCLLVALRARISPVLRISRGCVVSGSGPRRTYGRRRRSKCAPAAPQRIDLSLCSFAFCIPSVLRGPRRVLHVVTRLSAPAFALCAQVLGGPDPRGHVASVRPLPERPHVSHRPHRRLASLM